MKYFWGRWKWTKQTKHMGVIIEGSYKGVELRIKLALITLLPPRGRKTAKQSYALPVGWLFTVRAVPSPKSPSVIYLMSLGRHWCKQQVVTTVLFSYSNASFLVCPLESRGCAEHSAPSVLRGCSPRSSAECGGYNAPAAEGMYTQAKWLHPTQKCFFLAPLQLSNIDVIEQIFSICHRCLI